MLLDKIQSSTVIASTLIDCMMTSCLPLLSTKIKRSHLSYAEPFHTHPPPGPPAGPLQLLPVHVQVRRGGGAGGRISRLRAGLDGLGSNRGRRAAPVCAAHRRQHQHGGTGADRAERRLPAAGQALAGQRRGGESQLSLAAVQTSVFAYGSTPFLLQQLNLLHVTPACPSFELPLLNC